MIGNSSLVKDGFEFMLFVRKNDQLNFLRTEYAIKGQGEINFVFYIYRRDEAIRFMEKLDYEINRVDRLSVPLVVDCLSICANEMENSPNKDDILELLAFYFM